MTNIPEDARNEAWAEKAQDIVSQIDDLFAQVIPHPLENIYWWLALNEVRQGLEKRFADTQLDGKPRAQGDAD